MSIMNTFANGLRSCVLIFAVAAIPAFAADKPAKTDSSAKPADSSGGGAVTVLNYVKDSLNELKLSDEVQKKADALADKARDELAALPSGDDARKKAKAILDKFRDDVSGLLSNEQKLALQKKLLGMNTFLTIDKIKQQLHRSEMKLTDDQKKQLDEVLDDTTHKLKDLQDAKDVTTRSRAILVEMTEKLRKILSPEQLNGLGGGSKKPAQ